MISITILTKNSSKHIREVLNAITSFPEIILYDTGSSDNTCEIAKKFANVRLHHGPFEGFGATHNKASSLATYDWILSIDSDEVMTQELLREIQALVLERKSVYSFPRNNYYNGKRILWCGWSPDRVNRIYNRQDTRFSEHLVHEGIVTEGMRFTRKEKSNRIGRISRIAFGAG